MTERSAADFLPEHRSLAELRTAAAACRGCDLHRDATQTVFGEGAARARLMLVGEQPGDTEDRAGRPFVGPAGNLLRDALRDAGIDARAAYITNAVKHFKFIVRGKRRIHQKPRVIEMRACEPWLRAEIAAVEPELVVALGATAAQTLLGRDFRLTQQRGEALTSDYGVRVLATLHPSAILRAPDAAARERDFATLVGDLKVAAGLLAQPATR